VSIAAAPTALPTSTVWAIDPTRSRIAFAVRERVLFKELTVRGVLPDVSGAIELDERRPERSRVELSFAAAAVDTGNARRDRHLRSGDVLDAARFPEIAFRSRAVAPVAAEPGRYRVEGDLTLRGLRRPIALDVRALPGLLDGRRVVRFGASVVLDRRAFGIVLDIPVISIGGEIHVTATIEATPHQG